VVVQRIEPGSAAAAAGIRTDDVIAEINRQPVANAAQFERLYKQTRGKLLLLVVREGGAMYLMLDR
jgi:S1-C subfamily serine protease